MSKWRPSKECLYVIPDIHGQYNELQLILSRILPLRKTDGIKDRIVFLGDYVDRRIDSHLVIDKIIELKKEFGDQIITLIGNHELMFLNAMAPSTNSKAYMFWMKYGGVETLQGYIKRSGIKKDYKTKQSSNLEYIKEELDNPYTIARQRIKDFVPQEHKDFINSCLDYYETDDFIFVHGGCNPFRPMNDNLQPHQIASGLTPKSIFAWDRSLFNTLSVLSKNDQLNWDKTIITGHNGDTGKPFVLSKFMMLDCSCDNKLLVMEVNSREGFIAKKNKKRLVKLKI